MASSNAVRADQLYRACDPNALDFQTTNDVEPLTDALGQADAMAALEFGLSIRSPGYNILVIGPPGSGRLSFIRQVLRARAANEPAPSDWCYLFNFSDARQPLAFEFPAGRAREFADDLDTMVAELRKAIPRTLQSDEVAARRTALVGDQEKAAAEALNELRRELEPDPHVALVSGPGTLAVAPAKAGEPLDQTAYLDLPADMRTEVEEHLRAARERVLAAERKIQEQQREAQRRVAELNQEVARGMIGQRTASLKEKYGDVDGTSEHLDRMGDDMVRHVDQFTTAPEEESDAQKLLLGGAREDFFRRYQANPLVTHDPAAGAPVVEESNPNLSNLLGRVDRRIQFGAMVVDFTRIAAGALHRANGGYLILEAREVLARPLVWPALKRTLRTGELRPAEVAMELGLVTAESLEPEPIPPRLKVVLVGEPPLDQLLEVFDSEFRELFKVKADFRPEMERTAENEQGYAAFVAARGREESLPPFDVGAVAALIEEGSRRAGNQRKLSTRLAEVADLIRESAYWASAASRDTVAAADVERTVAERDRREKRIQRELLELIERGILTFEPAGEAVGQLYGIGLIALADLIFGRPIRVMASAFMGTGGLVNIEREARLSGPIHSKGFLVLSGYLGNRFARIRPLILSASLSFEQMYEEVEGDSASVAEL